MNTARQIRGAVSYQAGLAAEEIVAAYYDSRGRPIVAKRWRSTRGEIDLVAQDGEGLIFIEVKKSRTHGSAARHLSRQQIGRIIGAGAEFLSTQHRGQLTESRFDLALVDEQGRVDVIENAFMDW